MRRGYKACQGNLCVENLCPSRCICNVVALGLVGPLDSCVGIANTSFYYRMSVQPVSLLASDRVLPWSTNKNLFWPFNPECNARLWCGTVTLYLPLTRQLLQKAVFLLSPLLLVTSCIVACTKIVRFAFDQKAQIKPYVTICLEQLGALPFSILRAFYSYWTCFQLSGTWPVLATILFLRIFVPV